MKWRVNAESWKTPSRRSDGASLLPPRSTFGDARIPDW